MLLNQSNTNYENKIRSLNDTAERLLKCLPVDREKWTNGFSDVFALCVSRPVSHASDLYNSTVNLIKNRINEILEMLENLPNEELMRNYVQEWRKFHEGINQLNNLYSYVNSQYVKNLKPSEPDIFYGPTLIMAERHILEIIEVGLSHWKLCLIDRLKERLTSCLICQIEKDRNNITDEQDCIEPTLSSLLQLSELKNIDKFGTDVYEENFQVALETSTVKFYSGWVQDKLTKHDPPEFSQACLALKEEETIRAQKYFPSSIRCIQKIFQKIVVEENLAYINKCTRDLIEKNSVEQLHSIYRLLAEYNYFTNLLDEFHSYAKSRIVKTITDLSGDHSVVESFVLNLLNLRVEFSEFITNVFDQSSVFQTSLDKAYVQAISSCSAKKEL